MENQIGNYNLYSLNFSNNQAMFMQDKEYDRYMLHKVYEQYQKYRLDINCGKTNTWLLAAQVKIL